MFTVREKLRKNKIQKMQLDPFGFCNAKCWFCPVRYIPQPEEGGGNMSLDLMEKIFHDLSEEKKRPDGVVDPRFNFFTTAHYNEVLLYKHIKEMFDLARKYKFTTYVLSNGVSLHKHNVDLIAEYPDVVTHVGLNIPAFEKDLWAKRAGFAPEQFDRLMSNLEYATKRLAYMKNEFQIHVNGLNKAIFHNGWIKKGPEFDSHAYDLDNEHIRQGHLARKLFPTVHVNSSIIFDRAGFIHNVLSNEDHVKREMAGKKVVGCKNSGDRISDWLHVNSAGKVFLCCNDYNFEYQFGDLNTQTVNEIWRSEKHIEVVERAFKEICTKCLSASLETDVTKGSTVVGEMRFAR